MADHKLDLRGVNPREMFPWLHLLRGLKISLELKKIILAALGVVLMTGGWWVIGRFAPQGRVAAQVEARPDVESKVDVDITTRFPAIELKRLPWEAPPGGASDDVLRSPLNDGFTSQRVPTSFFLAFEPIRQLVFPVALMFQSTGSAFVGTLLGVWTLLVWGLFGGAITRIAAVQVAREGQVGLFEALRFALGRYFNYISAPILPFIGVVLIVTLCLLGGLLTRIPGFDIAMGAIWIMALVAGFVMTIALFGLAVGWPLMHAAISAEATESFDALSRAYSYVLGRPWNYFFYGVFALVYGGVVMILATTVGYTLVHLSQYAVSWGGAEEKLRQLYAYAPTAGGWREAFGPRAGEAGPEGTTRIAAGLIGFWITVAQLGLIGFAYSYFWSAATIVYFLLRRDVDETELEEVFIEEEEDEPFPTVMPLAGPAKPAQALASGTLGSLPIIDPPR